MEIVGAIVAEVVKSTTIFLCSKGFTLVKLHGNIKDLQKELQKLISRKNETEDDVTLVATAEVNDWIKRVEELEHEVQPILEEKNTNSINGCDIRSRFKLSKKAAKKLEEAKQLLTESCKFQRLMVERKPPIKLVERKPTISLAGQEAAEKKLEEILAHLNDEGIKRISVWGMGGVGKTTLVKNLNNLLESSPAMKSFDVVIWITVSKNFDLRGVQYQIAERLNIGLDAGESTERRAMNLQTALTGQKFLLILDDVWERIDLDIVGIPQGDDDVGTNCKILLTTRNLDVCREMMTNVDIKMEVLNEEVAWILFAESAGKVVESEQINPLARAIARKCCGLPLAIMTMGKSMRKRTKIELWKNALFQLEHSTPHVRSVEQEVYLPLKLSYISLPSKIHQWCFLYCSLYPENFSIKTNELIQCWIADGLIDDSPSLEKSYSYGIAIVETLKDSCLLEQGEGNGTVKIHNVVRDVAIWISKESGLFCQAGTSLPRMPQNLQKVSMMNSKTTKLPNQLLKCTELTMLLLQGNPLEKIPDVFFREIRALRFLNLSGTPIKSLPLSLQHLGELRALLLRDCCYLEKLPPLGDLQELQVLDLFGTRLRALPPGTARLGNLRELNLSRTHYLETIEAGTMLGLTSLQVLDMSFSAYRWDAKCNVGEQRAAFDELLSLELLSVLHIRLDSVDCLPLDSDWLKRLRKFDIRICPRSCDSNYLPTQHDEKRVILRAVDLMTRGLEGLVTNASALDLVTCGGMGNLSEVVAGNNLCSLSGLKSLTISGCDSITSLINGEIFLGSMLPNLEHLKLSRLTNLTKILEGVASRGGCLGKLKTIEVVNCRRMKNLITFSLLKQLNNLEDIKVGHCRRMKCLISGMSPGAAFPKLKFIELWDMANLRSVCSRTIDWPALEKVEVSNCPLLVKLPVSTRNASAIKQIKGELEWWEHIRWEDENIKSSLQQRFEARTISSVLTEIERAEEEKGTWQTLSRQKFHSHLHWEH